MAYVTLNETVTSMILTPVAEALSGSTVRIYASDDTELGSFTLADPAFGAAIIGGQKQLLNVPISVSISDSSGKEAQYATIIKDDIYIRLGESLGTKGVGAPGSGRQLILNQIVFDGSLINVTAMNIRVSGADDSTNAASFVSIYPTEGDYLQAGTQATLSAKVVNGDYVSFYYSINNGSAYELIGTSEIEDGIANVNWNVAEGANRIKVALHWIGGVIEQEINISTEPEPFEEFSLWWGDYEERDLNILAPSLGMALNRNGWTIITEGRWSNQTQSDVSLPINVAPKRYIQLYYKGGAYDSQFSSGIYLHNSPERQGSMRIGAVRNGARDIYGGSSGVPRKHIHHGYGFNNASRIFGEDIPIALTQQGNVLFIWDRNESTISLYQIDNEGEIETVIFDQHEITPITGDLWVGPWWDSRVNFFGMHMLSSDELVPKFWMNQ